jgi:hypothetical protein
MGFFSFLLFILVVLGGFVLTVIALVYRTFSQIGSSPQSNSFRQLVMALNKMLDVKVSQLVPWESDTLGLLCANPMEERSSGLFVKTRAEGTIGTIYQEPVASYVKSFLGQAAVFLVRTKTDAYLFRTTKQQTEVWINERPYCILVGKHIVSADNAGKLLAQLEGVDGANEQAVMVNGSTVATLTMVTHAEDVNPRAVQSAENMEPISSELVKILAFHQIAGQKQKA